MPSYPFPGYLDQTADLAGNLLRGYQAGAQVSEAGSRLAAESQRMGIEMAERQQQLQAEQARQQQQLAMTRAYHEAQIGLRRSQLEQTGQRIQMQTQATAQKLAEQEGYRRDFAAGVASGMDPATSARNAMLKHAGMFSSGAGLMQATKPLPQRPKWYPADPSTGAPGHFETEQGAVHIPAREQPGGISPTARLHALQQSAKDIQGDIANLKVIRKPTDKDKADITDKQKQLSSIQADIKRMVYGKQQVGGGIPAKALPARKSDLVVGETYQTKHGPATWNGTQFKRVVEPASTEESNAASE